MTTVPEIFNHQPPPDAPFTEIKGEHFGIALYRFWMMWGNLKVRRIIYTPYGHLYHTATWEINGIMVMTWHGDLQKFLDDKYERETQGKTILITEN